MSSVGVKIRTIRESKGISQQQLADAVGLSQPVVAKLEAGLQKSTKKLPEIARFLRVALSDLDPRFAIAIFDQDTRFSQAEPLDSNQNSSDFVRNIPFVKVIGVAQAGVWTEFEEFEDSEIHEEISRISGKYPHLPQFAFKVRGNSMDLARIFDGDYVVAVPYFDARSDIADGDTVILERKRAGSIERTVKIAQVVGNEVHFCPKSSDPRFKPIVVKVKRDMREGDGTEVRLVGLVVGRYGHV